MILSSQFPCFAPFCLFKKQRLAIRFFCVLLGLILEYNSQHSWRDGSHVWLTLNKHRKTKKRKRTLAVALASRAGGYVDDANPSASEHQPAPAVAIWHSICAASKPRDLCVLLVGFVHPLSDGAIRQLAEWQRF